jgi:hypothetical protein
MDSQDISKSLWPNKEGMTRFSIVVCSRRPERVQRIEASYRPVFGDAGFEFLHVSNARSLAAGYNGAVRQCCGAVVVFVHDDVELLDGDTAAKIEAGLAEVDILGVAGTDKLIDANWIAAGRPNIFGQVFHLDPNTNGYTHLFFGEVPRPMPRIQAIDGLLIAAGSAVFDRITFDAETFDGFHGYDVDFSFAAYNAGLRVGVARDLHVIHASSGLYDSVWEHYRNRFLKKYESVLSPPPTRTMPKVKETKMINRAALVRYLKTLPP